MLFHAMEQLIGNTPMLELHRLSEHRKLYGRLLVKLESHSISGSVKDRPALWMLQDARNCGLIGKDTTIIEPTSGNTGIALCALAAAWGIRCIIVMPDNMSIERRQLMEAYGAQVILTPGKLGMAGAVTEAERLAKTIPGSFLPGQFTNPENPQAHFLTTGPEIWQDTHGSVDVFLAGAGTGGTLAGAGRYLKRQKETIQIIAVDPVPETDHGIQGIGAGFPPPLLDSAGIDSRICVTRQEAITAARTLARTEGILAGISSGAALHAAMTLAALPEYSGKTIVALLPDSGERYLSTGLWKKEGL